MIRYFKLRFLKVKIKTNLRTNCEWVYSGVVFGVAQVLTRSRIPYFRFWLLQVSFQALVASTQLQESQIVWPSFSNEI